MGALAGIYEIVNKINEHRYIGQSIDIRYRWTVHQRNLRQGIHPNPYLQNAWSRYGEAAFMFRVMAPLHPPIMEGRLTELEQEAVDLFKPEYNIYTKCVSSPLGIKHTDEARAKMSEWQQNHRDEISAKLMGHEVSPETRAKLSAAHKGRGIGNKYSLGCHPTEEARAKRSASLMGNKNALGTHHPPETRAKMSASRMGNKNSLGYHQTIEHRSKISAANKGRALSEEHRAKISAARKLWWATHRI